MRFDESYNLSQMRLDRFHDSIMLRINLDMDSSVKSVCKFARSLTEISSKVYEPITYNKAIDNLIHGNRWRKAIDKEL